MRLLPLIIGVIFLTGCWSQGPSEERSVIPAGYSVSHAELRTFFLNDHAPKRWRKGAIAMEKTFFALVCYKSADTHVFITSRDLEWLKNKLETWETELNTREDEEVYQSYVLRFNSAEPMALEEISAEKTKRETWRATYQEFFREMQSLDQRGWVNDSLITEALDPDFKPYDDLYWQLYDRVLEVREKNMDRFYSFSPEPQMMISEPNYLCGIDGTDENWEEVRRIYGHP